MGPVRKGAGGEKRGFYTRHSAVLLVFALKDTPSRQSDLKYRMMYLPTMLRKILKPHNIRYLGTPFASLALRRGAYSISIRIESVGPTTYSCEISNDKRRCFITAEVAGGCDKTVSRKPLVACESPGMRRHNQKSKLSRSFYCVSIRTRCVLNPKVLI